MARRVGRYEVLDALSSGGMATVHIGKLLADSGFTRLVAIKRIHDALAGDRELRAMLRDEARLVARVRHTSVVSTLDVVEEGDELLLIMDYAHGPSLAQVARGEELPVAIVAAIASDLLEGLHAAHEATDEAGAALGLVHRDVSPENVIVGVDGVARVLDFGVAYAVGRSQRTMPGHIKGKPAYMAPEQAQGDEVDRRVDVYAASVVLWELLTGTRLFPAGSAAGAMLRHLEEIPKPPSALRPEVTPALDAVVLRGLAKHPGDRYPTARAMAEALEAAAPRASRAEVGAWIELHEAAFLAERAVLLARAESAAGGVEAMTPPDSTRAVTRAPPRSSVRLLAIAAAFVGLGTVAWRGAERTHPPVSEAGASAPAPPMPHGTRGAPCTVVALPVATDEDDLDLEPALTAMIPEIINDAPEVITGGTTRTRRLARTLQTEGRLTFGTWIAAAAQLGAPAVVMASALKQASGYAVTLRFVHPKSGIVWFERETQVATREATLGAVADLVLALRSALGDSSTPEQQARAANAFRGTNITAAAAYARSTEQTSSGSWDAALREANAAVAADPSFAMGRFAQALSYDNAGRKEDAERSYRATLAQADRLSEANRLLASGLYFAVRREPPQAIEQLQRYVERYPTNFGGSLDLANAYFSNRDMASAEKEARRGFGLGKSPLAHAYLALYAAYAGDFEESANDARAVVAGGDSVETAALALAHAELGLGALGEARAAYATLAQQGATAAARAALGEADIALAEERWADAETLLTAPSDAGADNTQPKRAALAETLLRMGRREQALAEADRLAPSSKDPAVLLALGRLYAEAHAEPRALALAMKLEARVDHESRAYAALVRGEVLLESGHAREAIARFEESRKEADPWLARFDLGRAYSKLGMHLEAYQELEACTKRRGEALAVFLDDVPTYRYWVPAVQQLAREKEALRTTDGP